MKNNYFFKKNVIKGLFVAMISFCGLLSIDANAQRNIGWTGAANNNWANAANWNYPAITSVATYTSSTATPVVTITLTTANAEIAVGDRVSGYGLAEGTTVTAIDATQRIITISTPTIAASSTPGTNVVFTFATAKPATGPPTIVDIALIANGGNPAIPAGTYNVAGITVSNQSGAITGSTLTIPADVEIYVDSSTNESLLMKGGNIVNEGYLDIKNTNAGGILSSAAGYGITCSRPEVSSTTPVTYSYSGAGVLKIDTSAGNNLSGGILLNGIGTNANNCTYRFNFGTAPLFLLSTRLSGVNSGVFAFRGTGVSSQPSSKVLLDGAGFDLGDSFSPFNNGFVTLSGSGMEFTIAPNTVINIVSGTSIASAVIGMYNFAGTPTSFINKGTITIKGTLPRSPFGWSAQNLGIINFVNEGILDVDVTITGGGNAIMSITNNGGATLPADVNYTNTGTTNFKTLLNGINPGIAINMTSFSGAPNLHITNSGTFNILSSNFVNGQRARDPLSTTQTGASRITNSGTINTNQELRGFYTINDSTGRINFLGTNESPLKLATFTVPTVAAAALGTTYTDSLNNVYTVVLAKSTGTGTALTTTVASNIANPPVTLASVGPPEVLASVLTRTGIGAGDNSIVYTANVTNGTNALFQTTLNSGVINTNTGSTAMTGITNVRNQTATSVLSPGGDSGRGIVTFGEITGDTLALLGVLKMQATGSSVAGVDFDQLVMTGVLDLIDVSNATLDVTGLYTPTAATTIDIITTNTAALAEGGVLGEFSSVIGLPTKWAVVYTGGAGGKVQLAYDPTLSAETFANFNFNVYPNPTTDILNLSAANNISKIELYNLVGQKVRTQVLDATQSSINVSDLQNGIYMMEVTIENAKKAYKIVKQ